MKLFKLVCILVFIMVCSVLSVSAAAPKVPGDINTALAQKIQQEHSTTRQFLVNEMKKNINYGIDEFTKRADYYERSYQDLTRTAVLKIALIIGGIFLFIESLMTLLRVKLDKKAYLAMRDTVVKDALAELRTELLQLPKELEKTDKITSLAEPKKALDKIFSTKQAQATEQPKLEQAQLPMQQQKPSRKERKLQKQLKKLQQKMLELQFKEQKLKHELGQGVM